MTRAAALYTHMLKVTYVNIKSRKKTGWSTHTHPNAITHMTVCELDNTRTERAQTNSRARTWRSRRPWEHKL